MRPTTGPASDLDEAAFVAAAAHAAASGHRVSGMAGAPYLCQDCDWASTHRDVGRAAR